MPSRAAPGWIRPQLAVYLGGILLLLVIGGIQLIELLRAWDRSIEDTRRQAAGLALVVEQDIERALQAIDLGLVSIAEQIAYAPRLRASPGDLALVMRSKIDRLPHIRSMLVTDKDGLIVASAPAPVAVPVGEREFFKRRRDNPQSGLMIHEPIRSQVTGTVFVPLTLRLEDSGGFAGVAIANMEPRALDSVYNALDLGRSGTINILTGSGILLARSPFLDSAIGQSFAQAPMFAIHLPRSTAGTFIGGANIDGIERMVAYRKLARFPLVVSVGVDLANARAAWADRLQTELGGFLITALAVGIAAILLTRAMGQQRRLLSQARDSDQRFRDFAEIASDWLYEMDAQFRFTYISPRREQVTGATIESRLGRTPWELATPDELARDAATYERFRRALEAREEFRSFEFWTTASDGERHCVAINGRPVFNAEGGFLGYRGTGTDQTEQKRTQDTVAEARARLEDAIESMTDGFALFDRDDRLVLWNRAFSGYYRDPNFVKPGLTFTDMIRAGLPNLHFPQAIGATPEEWMAERQRRHRNPSGPIEIERTNGHWDRVIESRTREGATVLLRADITESKARQQALAEARQRLEDAIDSMPDGFALFDRDDRLVLWNRAISEGFAAPGTVAAGMRFADISRDRVGRVVLPDALGETPEQWLAERLRRHQYPSGPIEIRRHDGRWHRVIESRTREGGYVMLRIDITELKLRQRTLAGILNALPASIALVDAKGVIVEANQRWTSYGGTDSLFGASFPVGADYLAACRAVAGPLADTAEALAGGLERALARDGQASVPLEYATQGGDRRSWHRVMVSPLSMQAQDGAVVMHMDVTERRATEETLAQAQKLEAVGQLTGGIAHDFNNLLTVILGQSDLLSLDLAKGSEHAEMAETISTAARRGADLTRQLLAFARRQPLQPARVQVNALIESMLPILRRALSATIEIHATLGEQVWPCLADPVQLEAALLNLAINARDAMEKSGVLTIETGTDTLDEHYAAQNPDAKPGDYVVVSVSDTGHGMSPDIMARVFEPFFTTKPVGHGTGLGLSMVYGFVKQTGGHIKIYSEVGRGTTVKLYLPRAGRVDAAPDGPAARATGATIAGTESLLLVEDDQMVRDFAAAQLRRLGYRVTEAESGAQALAILDSGAAFDLLFTDVVMPGGMTGHELAEKVRIARPGIKVLFTSGYPAGALQNNGGNNHGRDLIGKPYRIDDLARRLRALLDRA